MCARVCVHLARNSNDVSALNFKALKINAMNNILSGFVLILHMQSQGGKFEEALPVYRQLAALRADDYNARTAAGFCELQMV